MVFKSMREITRHLTSWRNLMLLASKSGTNLLQANFNRCWMRSRQGANRDLTLKRRKTKKTDGWTFLFRSLISLPAISPQTRRSTADTNFLPKTCKQTRLSQLIRKTSFASRPMCQKTSFASRLCQKTSMAD